MKKTKYRGRMPLNVFLLFICLIFIATYLKSDVDYKKKVRETFFDNIDISGTAIKKTAENALHAATQAPEVIDETLSNMEIYEAFLNGELTAEQQEQRLGQQVHISELFWDNDIEYCYFDIDGDGSEELHIRDHSVYYLVKVQDGTPHIIFEGWWSYQPVVTDKLCGILHHFRGYGSEEIAFIKINTDGAAQSEGTFYWSDYNKDGEIDEGDFFLGPGDTGRERYMQYKEEHVAKQTEKDLEWTDRRLKDFATWQEAYIDFIKKINVTLQLTEEGLEYLEYSLIYVDEDDIPELYIYTGFMASGEIVVSFYDGKIRAMNRGRSGIQYMERGGLLYNRNGATGFYPCNIYTLEKGEFTEIGTGWYSEYSDEDGNICDDYYWEGSAVSEAEYEAYIEELIDTSKCVEPAVLYSQEEILEILR